MVIDSNFSNGASLIPESSKADAIEAAAVQAVESSRVGVEFLSLKRRTSRVRTDRAFWMILDDLNNLAALKT